MLVMKFWKGMAIPFSHRPEKGL